MGILKVENLEKTFGRRRVVDGVSLYVQRGEIVGLLGPNGAGKSTTFKMICGLLNPDRGNVTLGGKDVTKWPMFERARNGGMGYLPQQSSIFGKLTVQQNLLMVMQLLKMGRKEQRSRCDELLEQFKIERLRKSKASKLSGGERRRLEIARCLVSNPEIIMLDEPFAGIDPVTVQSIRGVIEDLRDSGIAILITDHAATQVLQITDRTYVVSEGRILCSGTAEEIVQHDEVKRKYLGEIEYSATTSSRTSPGTKNRENAKNESMDVKEAPKAKPPTKIQLPKPAQSPASLPTISFGAEELTSAIDVVSTPESSGPRSTPPRPSVPGKIVSPFPRIQDEISIGSIANDSSGDSDQRIAAAQASPENTNADRQADSSKPNRKRVSRRKLIKRKAAQLSNSIDPASNTVNSTENAQVTEEGRRRIVSESDPDPTETTSPSGPMEQTGSKRSIPIATHSGQIVRKPVIADVIVPNSDKQKSDAASASKPIVFQEVAEVVEGLAESAEDAAKRVRSAIKRPKISKVAQFQKLKAPFSADDVER